MIMVKIIQLSDYRSFDPKKDYYDLSLEERFSRYKSLVPGIYDKKRKVIKPFEKERVSFQDGQLHEERLTPEQLTQELSQILPSFRGRVLGRIFFPINSLHYIVSEEDMHSLFGESPFGKYTGKVVGLHDGLLAFEHEDLSGLVIIQADQGNTDKNRFIADHEYSHSQWFSYPNGLRRDTSALQLRDTSSLSPLEIAELMITLSQAILIDEANACLESYSFLISDSKSGKSSLGEKVDLFRREYVLEVRNASKNMLGFHLDSLRQSGLIDQEHVALINHYELLSFRFPFEILRVVQTLSRTLTNPECLEPLGYAFSYVCEALQILDFEEVFEGGLEIFCRELMEPYRLYGRMNFGQALI